MAKEYSREEKNMFKKNVSLQKLMYMTVYDTLKKMFRKYLKKEEELECLYFREDEKSLCVWYLWNLKTCENGEVMSPFTLYRKLK